LLDDFGEKRTGLNESSVLTFDADATSGRAMARQDVERVDTDIFHARTRKQRPGTAQGG
jgi:hypothetical protein